MRKIEENTIMILGDSTSMAIGVDELTYPFQLANRKIWKAGTNFLNCSLPGITSADALAFISSYKTTELKKLKSVIVYLGNCDTTSSEVKKGRYNLWRKLSIFWSKLVSGEPRKTSLKNRLLHFEWNNRLDPDIESPEDPKDFEYNIGKIVKICKRLSVPVILVIPKANIHFPPGVGKGNFIFYRHLGLKEKLSERLAIPDARYINALRYQENGNFKDASNLYKEILLDQSAIQVSSEYPLLIVNNYAVAKAESGEYEEAIYLLNLLLKERQSRKEITYYNLAKIYKLLGDAEKYKKLLNESYESDDSLYRIRSPYVKALRNIVNEHVGLNVIDMYLLLGDEYFLDHCHPLPEGQIILADAVQKVLDNLNLGGDEYATIVNRLFNPELANGNTLEFHDYFKSFAPLALEDIRNYISRFSDILNNHRDNVFSEAEYKQFPMEIRSALEYYSRHPFFANCLDIIMHPPEVPSDVGRFPEYFLVRYMIPFLVFHETDPELKTRFANSKKILRSSKQLKKVLPENAAKYLKVNLPELDKDYEKAHVKAVLDKVRKVIKDNILEGSQFYERRKTTIFWYVRETLRFGAHSRVSMLYDRISLEYAAEALAAVGVIDKLLELKCASEITELVEKLETLVDVHEIYCAKIISTDNIEKNLEEYDQKLKDLMGTIADTPATICVP